MDYEWDAGKADENVKKHDVPFEAIENFDWETVVVPDDRRDYGEARWLAIGLIDGRLHSLAFTMRGVRIRVISLRIAGRKERKLFDEQG